MDTRKIYLTFIALMILFIPNVYAASIFDYPTVAVIPFSKKAAVSPDLTLKDASIASDEVYTELMTQAPERFDLVERENINKNLDEIYLGMSGVIDPTTAAQFGRILGAQYLLVGSIDGLAVVKKTGEVIGIGSKSYKVVARISARVIETETARVVLAARGIGETTNSLTRVPFRVIRIGSDSVDQEQVSSSIQKAAEDLVKNLLINMDKKAALEGRR